MSAALCKINHKHIVVYVALEVLDDGWLGLHRVTAGSDKDRVWSWIRMDRLTTEINEVFTLRSLVIGAVDRVDSRPVI